MRPSRVLLAAAALLLGAGAAQADCRAMDFEDQGFSVCTAQAGEDLRLFLNDGDGEVYGSFSRIEAELDGARLVFAMNAGMFHSDCRPVGLYVEDQQQAMRLITSAGPGNFGMLPNGVFCIGDGAFSIWESRAFAEAAPDCRHATQSGPMLVIEGELHPRFLPDSTSRHVRNGVGVSKDGLTATFVISDSPVTFHHFARFFRDELGLDQALYFDGSVSRLYAPELDRSDWGLPLGPIIGLVVPAG